MTPNKTAQLESTLLSVIAQAHARGANYEDVRRYVEQLSYASSRQLVEHLFGRNGGEDQGAQRSTHSSLEQWAETLAY